jgi:Chaperone of endosialidase
MKSGSSKPRRWPGDSIRSKGAVLATALLVLCGTAYAASGLPKGSVGTKQLKNGAVNSAKVKNNSLTGSDINVSTLGTVPNAVHAASVDNAAHAASADNADTLDGKHASEFLGVNATAANSDTLDGKHAYDFLGANETALNSDMLDGKHSYEFLGANATAANAERLGNLLPSDFLLTGTYAGGDLVGPYPNPSIADGAITAAKVADANKDGAPGVPSLRTLGSGAQQAMPGNASPGGPPTGAAGGALQGTYPNPTLKVTGGPCANGKALTDVSSGAALTCKPGVYSDNSTNLAVAPDPLPALQSGAGANSAFGFNALESNTTGGANSAYGWESLFSNTTGEGNSALGFLALSHQTAGNYNSAVGLQALWNSKGDRNSGLGYFALGENLGNENSGIGREALIHNQGDFNAALGTKALGENRGDYNIGIGYRALPNNTEGSGNVAIGSNALQGNSEGSNNIAVGSNAGLNTGPYLDDNIDIGNEGVMHDAGTIRIGTEGTHTKAFLAGVSGVAPGGTTAPVVINEDGQLGDTSSSRRFKQNIGPLEPQIGKLMQLRPVSFRYRRSFVHGPNPVQFGLIAEQVARVFPNLVVRGEDGRPSAVAYQELPALLLAQVQREYRRNEALRAQNRRQDAQIARQQEQIDWLIRQARRR